MFVKGVIINVHFINDSKNFKVVEVFDNLGKQYRKLEVQRSNMQIDLTGISIGVYIVIIRNENNTVSRNKPIVLKIIE